ncbi:hypothetical protein PSTT_12526 [Puccinia striiformis]|uniref:No apical meristem-associated C-terminal domain-containing protein n=1 Tax=Puccinia striiformis TaxID=27350 RepID=A0A2S4UVY7_9BASI|nr:hypothetical protein PSTT_12526 [Puccinia striiformis]
MDMIDSSLDFLATELNESTRVAPASNKDGPRPDRDSTQKIESKKDNDIKHKQNRGGNYTEREDIEIRKAWVAITEDSQVGTDQDSKKFWARIHNIYTIAFPPPTRTQKSIKGRFGIIQKEANKFRGCAAQVKNLNPSGRTLEDKLEMTQRTYEVDQGCSFTHIWCYNVLVKCAKWHTYCRQTIEKEVARKKRARSPNNNDQGLEGSPEPPATSTDSAATDACPESDTGGVLERPIGKKKAKALHRAKGKGVDDWKDGVATAQSEIAIQAKRQNDIFESDSKSLQSIAKTAQTNAEIAIMNKNLDNCSELVRRYYEAWQRAIVEALESQGN